MSKKVKITRFAPKLHVKKGDKVKVIAGNYKGETGEVLEVFPDKNRAIVDNVNMKLNITFVDNDISVEWRR